MPRKKAHLLLFMLIRFVLAECDCYPAIRMRPRLTVAAVACDCSPAIRMVTPPGDELNHFTASRRHIPTNNKMTTQLEAACHASSHHRWRSRDMDVPQHKERARQAELTRPFYLLVSAIISQQLFELQHQPSRYKDLREEQLLRHP